MGFRTHVARSFAEVFDHKNLRIVQRVKHPPLREHCTLRPRQTTGAVPCEVSYSFTSAAAAAAWRCYGRPRCSSSVHRRCLHKRSILWQPCCRLSCHYCREYIILITLLQQIMGSKLKN